MIQVCLDFKEDLRFFGNSPNQKYFTLIQKTAKRFRKALARSVHNNRAKNFRKSPLKISKYAPTSYRKHILDFQSMIKIESFESSILLTWSSNQFRKYKFEFSCFFVSNWNKFCTSCLLFNLFETSKNETTNSPIHEFKVLHKGQRAF